MSQSRSRSQSLVLTPAAADTPAQPRPPGREVAAGLWWGCGGWGARLELQAGLWGCCRRPRPGLLCPRGSGQLRPGQQSGTGEGGGLSRLWEGQWPGPAALLTSVPFPTEDGGGGWACSPLLLLLAQLASAERTGWGRRRGCSPGCFCPSCPLWRGGQGALRGAPRRRLPAFGSAAGGPQGASVQRALGPGPAGRGGSAGVQGVTGSPQTQWPAPAILPLSSCLGVFPPRRRGRPRGGTEDRDGGTDTGAQAGGGGSHQH